MLGKTISHYKILEKLGEGGMGVVFKAQDTKLKRTVAIKFLLPELTQDKQAKDRFINEAQAASALDHPNVCTIFEIGEIEEGELFIAMAFYEGEPLRNALKRGPVDIDEAIRLASQIAGGLAKAHGKGIIHRDIKPANIIVTNDGIPKIVDFGLAFLAGQSRLTKTGSTQGTIAYMSPEQMRGEQVDHRTDIWSLGVVLFEMLTGQLPFTGEYEPALMYSILNEKPKRISDLLPGSARQLDLIGEKTLAKNRNERYQSMADLIADLKAFQELRVTGLAENRAEAAKQRKKSVAVLPFRSLSDNKEDEYFSDGTTEDIITQLSKIGELRVISRTSVMRYKNSDKSIPEIGRELDVAALLEGSVRHIGDRVRIVAQLLDAKSDEHIWAETYDRDMKDIFAIQSDVAEKIAAALRANLSPDEKKRLEGRPTANMAAYDYYLKAREYYYRYRKQDNETAVALFRKALELDPNYALACAGLGDAYAQRFARFGMGRSWVDSAIEVSKKAISLDGNSAEGYKALGTAYIYEGQREKALEVLQKAIEFNPNFYPAMNNVGTIYVDAGELDKAILWFEKSAAIDPTSVFARTMMAETYRKLGEIDKSEQILKRALELQPDFVDGLYYLCLVYFIQGRFEEIGNLLQSAVSSNPDNPRVLEGAGMTMGFLRDFSTAREYYLRSRDANTSFETDVLAVSGIGLGHILMREGRRDEAEEFLNQAASVREKAIREGDLSSEIRFELARVHAIKGNKEEAYDWLEKAISMGWVDYQIVGMDPWLDDLRGDERFKQIMARVKDKVAEMRARVEKMEKTWTS